MVVLRPEHDQGGERDERTVGGAEGRRRERVGKRDVEAQAYGADVNGPEARASNRFNQSEVPF